MWAPSFRCGARAFAFALTLLGATPIHAGPEARVRVHGSSHIDATATVTSQATELAGRVTDDAGRAIAGARVRVRWATETARPPARPTRCNAAPAARLSGRSLGDEDVADADESGQFCLRWPLEIRDGKLRLDFDDSTRLLDPSSLTVELERRAPFELVFAPSPRTLSADDTKVTVVVQARAHAGASFDRVPVALAWSHVGKAATELAHGELRKDEALRFSFSPSLLGAPGSGELTASADVEGQEIRARAVVSVTARVTLEVTPKVDASADGEAELDVKIGSAFGRVPSGSIEALVAGRTVGIALVTKGAAQVPIALPASPGEVPVSIRYLSAAPWWVPSSGVTVRVTVPRRTAWRWLPWALALLVIAAWLLPAWRRPLRREVPVQPRAPVAARPDLAWISPANAAEGWSGQVLDAHDQSAVAEAKIVIAWADGGVFEAQADAEGNFVLDPKGRRGQTGMIRVEAAYHAALERPLPPPGRLTVSLLTRRRALLARLVEWAERRGAPYTRVKEPTPSELSQTAERAGQAEVGAWASAVEATAFGPNPVDKTLEAEVTSVEPPTEAPS